MLRGRGYVLGGRSASRGGVFRLAIVPIWHKVGSSHDGVENCTDAPNIRFARWLVHTEFGRSFIGLWSCICEDSTIFTNELDKIFHATQFFRHRCLLLRSAIARTSIEISSWRGSGISNRIASAVVEAVGRQFGS